MGASLLALAKSIYYLYFLFLVLLIIQKSVLPTKPMCVRLLFLDLNKFLNQYVTANK